MYRRVLTLFVLSVFWSMTAWAQDSTYDMEKSVSRALAANPQMQSAKQQIYGAQEGVRAATAAFAPTATVTAYSWAARTNTPLSVTQTLASGDTLTVGQSSKWYQSYLVNVDLNVTQPLFTGFRLLSTYQKAKLSKTQADETFRRTELTMIKTVQTAFLSLLKARSDVKSSEDSVARLKSQYKVTKAFFDVGLRPRLDVLQAEADLATAEQTRLAAKNNVDIQLATLNSLLNIPLDAPLDYVGELNYSPFKMTLQNALDEAYKYRPDISIALKSVEIAEKDAKIALSPMLPQLQASYDYIRQSDHLDFRNTDVPMTSSFYTERHQFQITVSWKAWDWGQTFFTYRQADDNTKKLRADLAKLRLDVGADVKTQYLNIQSAAKRISVARVGLDAAKEAYRQAVARYQAQVGTNNDVLTAQSQVSTADGQLTQALTDYQTAVANLYYSIGRKNLNLSL